MSQHTPGPWKVHKTHYNAIEPADGKGPTVAFTAWGGKMNGQDDADARLIAKAPEMYLEIQTTLEDLNTVIDNLQYWKEKQIVKHLMEIQRRQRALLQVIPAGRGHIYAYTEQGK